MLWLGKQYFTGRSGGKWHRCAKWSLDVSWRKILITLIGTEKGEGKAHTCAIAWFRQLRTGKHRSHWQSRLSLLILSL
jgi:hypothetical protein